MLGAMCSRSAAEDYERGRRLPSGLAVFVDHRAGDLSGVARERDLEMRALRAAREIDFQIGRRRAIDFHGVDVAIFG